MDLDAVESRGLGVLGALAERLHDAGQFLGRQRARHHVGPLRAHQADMALGRDRARRHRQRTAVKDRIRDAPDMPELQEDPSARLVHAVGDALQPSTCSCDQTPGVCGIADAHAA